MKISNISPQSKEIEFEGKCTRRTIVTEFLHIETHVLVHVIKIQFTTVI